MLATAVRSMCTEGAAKFAGYNGAQHRVLIPHPSDTLGPGPGRNLHAVVFSGFACRDKLIKTIKACSCEEQLPETVLYDVRFIQPASLKQEPEKLNAPVDVDTCSAREFGRSVLVKEHSCFLESANRDQVTTLLKTWTAVHIYMQIGTSIGISSNRSSNCNDG